MPDSPSATAHIDGAARGNPGPAAYAVVLRRPDAPTVEESDTLGKTTNNIAEYTALIRALELAAELGVKDLTVFSDSELMVKQMAGEYRVKNVDLKDLYGAAQDLKKEFDRLTITHVRREENRDADRLCNEALDGRPRRRGAPPPPERDVEVALETLARPPRSSGKGSPSRAPEALEAEAIALLNAVAKAWGAGKQDPPMHEVWDRIWTILGEHGVLKRPI